MRGDDNNTILIVEDNPEIVKMIERYLLKEGFTVKALCKGKEAIEKLKVINPILILLDLNLPDCDGLEVMNYVKSATTIPIIMLTGRSREEDMYMGFENGADDYITKPFRIKEVMARIKAILRRSLTPKNVTEKILINDVLLEVESKSVWRKGKKIPLTPTEFKLLKVLMENAGNILSRAQIVEKIHGYLYEGLERTLDSHIKNLRTKIEDNPKNPRYIETVFREGYRYKR